MRDGDFRIRGKEISRVEGLSDAVFGFSITLLVVSLEVPHTAAEALHAMRGFFAFTLTFTILFSVWRMQFAFFRRYGLEDGTTVNLTAVLLFVILFFVYPLKFIIGAFVDRIFFKAGFIASAEAIKGADFTLMYLAFSLGWAAVFLVFSFLYQHAYQKREQLQLTPVEVFDTRRMKTRFLLSVIPGVILAIINLLIYVMPTKEDQIVYATVPLLLLFGGMMRRQRGQLRTRRSALLAEEARTVEA